MRKVLVSLAVLALIAAPAMAFTINLVPKTTGATAPMRPEVNGAWIAAVNGEGSGNTGGILYDTGTSTLSGNVAAIQLQNTGYWHEPQADISNYYAAFGGSPSNLSATYGINVLNRTTSGIINIPAADANEHLTSLNNWGDVVWLAWGDGPNPDGIMYSNVIHGVATTPVQLVATPASGQGDRLRMATSARRFAYRPINSAGQELWVYDMGTAQNVKIFDTTVDVGPSGGLNDGKAYISGIDDSGKWLVTNMRSVAAGGQKSDIYLFNIANLGAVTKGGLFGNTAVIREDPRLQVINADTGIIVWDEDNTNSNAFFNIRYAYVTGLSTNTPVIGAPVDITTYSAGVSNCRWPDVDVTASGDVLVAWLNTATTQIEYTTIPEPASLGLLALGGLALLRRR